MSDELLNLNNELLKNEELDVEAHRRAAKDEPAAETEDDEEVEAHIRKASPRHI
jgi:hypothetical protein